MEGPQRIDLGGGGGGIPGGSHEGLGRQIVDFVKPHFNHAAHVAGGGHVTHMEGNLGSDVEKVKVGEVGDVASHHPMDLIPPAEEVGG